MTGMTSMTGNIGSKQFCIQFFFNRELPVIPVIPVIETGFFKNSSPSRAHKRRRL